MAKLLIALIFFGSLNMSLKAQPGDVQVKKDAIGAGDGVISFSFSKPTGTERWNADLKIYEYVRGVVVKRKSDYPGINLIVKGDVVYQVLSKGNYSYWKFRILSNEYEGLANPAESEITNLLKQNWQKFYGYYYGTITKLIHAPTLHEEPHWVWHSPKSVEFWMNTTFDHIISNTQIETLEAVWKVRLYRNDIKEPWNNFSAFMSNDFSQKKKLGVQSFSVEQVKDLQKKTLQYVGMEAQAQQAVAELPSVAVPDFNDATSLIHFVHNKLRTATAVEFKSVLYKLLAPNFFVSGSNTQLTIDGAQQVALILLNAFQNKATYNLMYCEQAPIRIEKSVTQAETFYISSAIANTNSVIGVDAFNTGYKEGVAQKAFKINRIQINVRQDNDAINFINSFSDRSKLCK